MAPQRTCLACDGSGHRPVYGYACWGNLYDECYSCPVCAGRGTVDAKASRADAVSDGSTVDLFAVASRATRGAKHEFASAIFDAEFYGLRAIRHENADSASSAARAAFKAVPGLRGE